MCAAVATGCVEMGNEAAKAAKAAGWEPTEPLDGKATPSVQSGLINQLVAEKVGGIVLVAIQPENVAAAIKGATEAGIPVADLYTPRDKDSGGVTLVNQDGVETGEFLAHYIAAEANPEGPTKVEVVGDDPAFKVVTERVEGIEAGLEKYCPECELHITPLSASEQAKPGPPAFSALLASNPPGTLEWVIGGPSDSFAEPMMATAEQQGRTEIKMLGTDSSPKVLENLAEGGITQADTFSAYRYAGWAGVDEVIRQAVGLKPWNAEKLPYAYITKENVNEATADLPQWYTPPSFDYEAMFKKLWSGK
jgi:ABC-type sugar transport system substrate-binding protein